MRALSERNRKLGCLYAVGEVLHTRDPGPESFESVVRLVRRATTHPETTFVRLLLDDATYDSDPISGAVACLRLDLEAGGHKRGYLEFLRPASNDTGSDGVSSPDRDLADAVARQLNDFLERREAVARLIQASKLASIGELAASVSHEICNPLNGIINCVDLLLLEPPLNTEARAYLDMIRAEAERVAHIARNMLRFSRRDLERHSRVSVRSLFDEVLGVIGKRIERSRIRVEMDLPDSLPPLLCHKDEILQVFMNLLANSIHALDERFPEPSPQKQLRVVAREGELEGHGLVRFTVEDHGAGIAPEHMEWLFEPFFTTKSRDKGTGLGLAVSEGIVKAHGGAILVESEPAVCTRFYVDLPLDHDWTMAGPAGPETVWKS